MGSSLLEVDELTVIYETEGEDITAVSNATFSVDSSEFLGLVGESGCGKSTIAKALIGALDVNGTIDSGGVYYDGAKIDEYSEQRLNEEIRWSEISFIPQSSMDSLDPLRTIEDQAKEIAKVHDADPTIALETFRELFELMGLPEERITDYPHQFSGGMQQRVIIAMALFLEPSIVIADEPTTALDVIMQDQVFKYMDKINDTLDTSLILITHDISLVFESCERMAVMHAGQIAESGTTDELYDSPGHPYSIMLQQAFPDVDNPNRDLTTIDEYPPRNAGTVNYCTFVDRCPWAVADCRSIEPPLERVDDDSSHSVACHQRERVEEFEARAGDQGE
jgi:oligopeptide/dipeptide ABC transporter ATP-binding protein